MKHTILLCLTITCICAFYACYVMADVWFVQAEDFEEERSVLAINEKGVNVLWSINDDKKALGEKYMTLGGANRNNCEACAPLFYPISRIREDGAYKLWSRCIMETTGSDSFYWKISNDGGKTFAPLKEAHGGAQWADWEWKLPWDGVQLKKGKDNVLVIAERENNTKLDVFCLRNDNQIPTDDESLKWLEEHQGDDFAVTSKQKVAITWGKIKG